MTTWWRGVQLDDRSAAMMEELTRLVGPDVNVRPTQGSYSGGVAASGGTHDGGGAIDLAGQDAGMTQYDREVIRNTGRMVGWAMWIRDPSQSDWPWHIHGEAVQPDGKWDQGCLSSGAHGQVVDYFEGRNGLASGAPDDGPRDYVGVTWESYQGSAPAPAPPPPIKEDTVASVMVNGQLNIFVIDTSGGIQQNIAGDTAWTGWLLGIPGQWSKGLSATTDDDGNLSLVGIGADGVTVQQAWSTPEGWHGPVPFPGVESIQVTSRPTAELVTLAFAGTVCLVLILIAAGMAVAGIVQPNGPLVGQYLNGLTTATATILGAALGLLAGRRTGRDTVVPARSEPEA